MALIITEECINCDICEPKCPNKAIFMGPEIYQINPAYCTECVGHFDQPQCQQICPVNCIILDTHSIETKEILLEKYQKLNKPSKIH